MLLVILLLLLVSASAYEVEYPPDGVVDTEEVEFGDPVSASKEFINTIRYSGLDSVPLLGALKPLVPYKSSGTIVSRTNDGMSAVIDLGSLTGIRHCETKHGVQFIPIPTAPLLWMMRYSSEPDYFRDSARLIKMQMGGYVDRNPVVIDADCISYVRTFSIMEAGCSLPRKCGEPHTHRKVLSWYGRELVFCVGTAARDSLINMDREIDWYPLFNYFFARREVVVRLPDGFVHARWDAIERKWTRPVRRIAYNTTGFRVPLPAPNMWHTYRPTFVRSKVRGRDLIGAVSRACSLVRPEYTSTGEVIVGGSFTIEYDDATHRACVGARRLEEFDILSLCRHSTLRDWQADSYLHPDAYIRRSAALRTNVISVHSTWFEVGDAATAELSSDAFLPICPTHFDDYHLVDIISVIGMSVGALKQGKYYPVYSSVPFSKIMFANEVPRMFVGTTPLKFIEQRECHDVARKLANPFTGLYRPLLQALIDVIEPIIGSALNTVDRLVHIVIKIVHQLVVGVCKLLVSAMEELESLLTEVSRMVMRIAKILFRDFVVLLTELLDIVVSTIESMVPVVGQTCYRLVSVSIQILSVVTRSVFEPLAGLLQIGPLFTAVVFGLSVHWWTKSYSTTTVLSVLLYTLATLATYLRNYDDLHQR